MRTQRMTVLYLNLMVWLLVSCSNPAEKKPESQSSVAEEGAVLNEGQIQPKQAPRKPDLYVKAVSGLRLRQEPNPASKLLTTIPFGAQIQVLDSISTGQFVVEGQPGKMIAVQYENRKGFVFDRFTTPGAAFDSRQFKDGTYCFKSSGASGYEYRAFIVEGNRITQGSGDGHTAYDEGSWTLSFEGIFDESGKILVRAVVENESGVQAPCLETWEITQADMLQVLKPGNKVSTFKKTACVH